LFKDKQGLFKENKPIPIDVREKRTNMEIKDVTTEDVTSREYKKFQTADDETNQLQKMHKSTSLGGIYRKLKEIVMPL
jgi:hypothetical protein